MSGRAVASYADTLERYEAMGMPAAVAAELLVERIARTQSTVGATLEAFNALVASVEVTSLVLEGEASPQQLMRHLLQTKLSLARIYHFVSGVAPEADIEGVASQEETAAMIADSEAELARWDARPE